MLKKRRFAFMIHPRIIDDLGRRTGKMLGIGEDWGMKLLPKIPSEWALKHLSGRAGFTICSQFDVCGEAEGYIIAVLLTGQQMICLPPKYVLKRIMDAIIFAQDKLGVERIGLGAYTAPMTKNGSAVVNDSRITCAITHGDHLSAASSVEATKQAAALRGLDISQAAVAVVGAYGVVGRPSAILHSELGPRKMILTGPQAKKLNAIKAELLATNYAGDICVSSNNAAIKEADVVILSTTSSGTIIVPDILKKDAVVVDMAQPWNMDKLVCDARPDVMRIDGGYMSINDINLRFKMGPPRGTTFACLTETIMSVLLGDNENHVGQVDVEFARRAYAIAKSVGFDLAPLTNFSETITGQ